MGATGLSSAFLEPFYFAAELAKGVLRCAQPPKFPSRPRPIFSQPIATFPWPPAKTFLPMPTAVGWPGIRFPPKKPSEVSAIW